MVNLCSSDWLTLLFRWFTTSLPWWGWSCSKERSSFMMRTPMTQQRRTVETLCYEELSLQNPTTVRTTLTTWCHPLSCWWSLLWSTSGMISFTVMPHTVCWKQNTCCMNNISNSNTNKIRTINKLIKHICKGKKRGQGLFLEEHQVSDGSQKRKYHWQLLKS